MTALHQVGKELNNELNKNEFLTQETVDHFFNFLNDHQEGTFLNQQSEKFNFGKHFQAHHLCLQVNQVKLLENEVKNNPVVNFLTGQFVKLR